MSACGGGSERGGDRRDDACSAGEPALKLAEEGWLSRARGDLDHVIPRWWRRERIALPSAAGVSA